MKDKFFRTCRPLFVAPFRTILSLTIMALWVASLIAVTVNHSVFIIVYCCIMTLLESLYLCGLVLWDAIEFEKEMQS
jgi:FtsH-binding integral membrane protein